MRRQKATEWTVARLEQLERTSEELLSLILAAEETLRFEKGEIVDVHLPVGACFKAKIMDRLGSRFSFRIIEHLDPAHCEDDETSNESIP
jgi:hypothetical protein